MDSVGARLGVRIFPSSKSKFTIRWVEGWDVVRQPSQLDGLLEDICHQDVSVRGSAEEVLSSFEDFGFSVCAV
jgi:hypothetical protein